MAFNYKEEYKNWISEKEIEEELLRTLGVSEDVINELRIIDKNIFNSNRRFYRNENVTDTGFFTSKTDTHNFKDISKLDTVLENLNNVRNHCNHKLDIIEQNNKSNMNGVNN